MIDNTCAQRLEAGLHCSKPTLKPKYVNTSVVGLAMSKIYWPVMLDNTQGLEAGLHCSKPTLKQGDVHKSIVASPGAGHVKNLLSSYD